jgi:hypothetical protein
MFKRFDASAIAWVLLVPVLGLAQEAKAPTVVVRVRSVDTVIENIKLVVELAGRENVAQQIEGLIKTKIGPNGLEGIDPKRPFGGYARIGKEIEDVAGVIMLPIADEKAFLGLLENLNFQVTKDKKGIYSFNPGLPVNISFRFAHKYAYVTAINLDALEPGNLIPPGKVFPAQQTAALSASVRLDQLPNAAKLIAIAQVEQKLEEAQNKREPGETEKQREFRVQLLKRIGKHFQAVLEDGAEVGIDLDINKAAGVLTADLRLSAQPNTSLATTIEKLGKTPSLFGGLVGPNSAANGLIHFIPAEDIRKSLRVIVDEAMKKALDSIRDEGKRKQAESLVQALSPTLKAGEIDVAFALTGPGKDKHYNLVLAGKVKDGDNLGKTVRKLVTDLLAEIPPAEAAKIKLDADSVGDVKIHRLDFQGTFDAKAKEVFGDNPILVAFRDDAIFLAVGEGALPALKKGLTAQPAASSPLLQVEVSLARLAPLLAKTDEQIEAVGKAFAGGDQGTVRVRLQGGSDLRLSFSTRLSVLQVLSTVIGRKLGQ